MQKTFLIFAVISLLSCYDLAKQELMRYTTYTLKQYPIKDEQKENASDSLKLSKILDSALKYAWQFRSKEFFKHDFKAYPDDTSFVVTVQIIYGYLFSKGKKHLLIRQEVPWATYCNVYLFQDEQFKAVIKREQGGMTYIGDTATDVNGDNNKDFVVHWYPSSGCCLAEMYNVYLYQSQEGNFTHDYQFINPTFFPKEKIIIGLEYGHPGETGLYKYKWNGFQIDTIEFIYPCYDQKNKFVKTTHQEYRPTENEGVILNRLPKDYREIDSNSLKWFFDRY